MGSASGKGAFHHAWHTRVHFLSGYTHVFTRSLSFGGSMLVHKHCLHACNSHVGRRAMFSCVCVYEGHVCHGSVHKGHMCAGARGLCVCM